MDSSLCSATGLLILLYSPPVPSVLAEQGVSGEAIAEAYHAFETGKTSNPWSMSAISTQTVQESMRLLLMVRAYQVGHACVCTLACRGLAPATFACIHRPCAACPTLLPTTPFPLPASSFLLLLHIITSHTHARTHTQHTHTHSHTHIQNCTSHTRVYKKNSIRSYRYTMLLSHSFSIFIKKFVRLY